ncbi:MAG: polysaccharide biosynthesis protein, partial [Ruminococcus sp.]|nr:polysaccharide biosynthesis protein [Ruminococcus sp.]
LSITVFILCGLYNSIWSFASVVELLHILTAYGILALLGAGYLFWAEQPLPNSFYVISGIFCMVCTVTIRFSYRLMRSLKSYFTYFSDSAGRENVMIIGAGEAGRTLATELEKTSYVKTRVVCAIDDNAAKHGKRLCGVPIVGGREAIPAAVKEYKVHRIILAIPSCAPSDRKEILDLCATTGCKVQVVPGIYQLVTEEVSVSKLRKVDPQDLLGRDPIQVNMEEIFDYISGKVVMVTGGGGSIGSELSRQIARANPKLLIIFDIYENNAYDIQQELRLEYGDSLDLVTLIASVRDYNKIESIFRQYRPQVVFHAAAHKHVPLMETVPEEAVKNNIFGTFNVATLAEYYKADKFVMISTDKAVNPTNVMGATKRACEMIIQYKAQNTDHTEFVTTRFGNVLGSNGSVIPLFRRQIESGAPVTVTHPDIIRYFMTIPEAVSLVLEAGAMAKGGEIFVLDMGAPVKITTLAENLIRMYGKVPYKDVPIVFTGLRPGEKLFEELLMDEEGLQSTANKKIFIGNQITIDSDDMLKKLNALHDAAEANDSEKTVELLSTLVPTFHHQVPEK